MDNPITNIEKKIEKTLSTVEKKVENEIKEIEKEAVVVEKKIFQNKWIQSAAIVLIFALIAIGFIYFRLASTRISIDKSQISAPVIDLSPSAPDILQEVYVSEGDYVLADTVVAKVGEQLLKTKTAGRIIVVNNDIGKVFGAGQAVVSMIEPSQLHVVGTLEENKGLKNVHVGQLANFTVDAFGSKKYQGVVDEVSPSSHESGVVFNISDNRATQSFDVRVRFDYQAYPELKNGMSAKITIFK
jgi:multidrug resistance efflux pump